MTEGNEEKVCQWTEDHDGVWWTTCGNGWCFTDGGPYDNKMCYCCYCGQPIKEHESQDEG